MGAADDGGAWTSLQVDGGDRSQQRKERVVRFSGPSLPTSAAYTWGTGKAEGPLPTGEHAKPPGVVLI